MGPIHEHMTRRPVRRRGRTRGGRADVDGSIALADVGSFDGGTRRRAAQSLQGQLGNAAVQRLVEDAQRPKAPSPRHGAVLAQLKAVEQALVPAQHVPTRPEPTRDEDTRRGFFDDAENAVLGTVADVQQTFETAQQTVPGFQQAVDVVEGIAQGSAGLLPTVTQAFTATGEQLGAQAASALGLTDEENVVGDPADQPTSIADRIEDQVSDVVKQAEAAAGQFKEDNRGLFQTLDDVVGQLGRPLELGDDQLAQLQQQLAGVVSDIGSGLQNGFGIDDPLQLSGGGGAGKTNLTVTQASDVHKDATLNDVATALANQSEAGSVVSDVKPPSNITTDAAGRITGLTIDVVETVTLPTWTNADKQCKPIKDEWDRFSAAIAAHENRHLELDKARLGDIAQKCIGVKEDDLDDKIDKIRKQADQENADFDSLAQSDHGRKQGTKIDAGIRCSEKV